MVALVSDRTEMRFTRFPPLPLNGPYRPRRPLPAAMQEHRTTWWQQHRNHVAARWREARASLKSLPPGPRAGILRLADLLAARTPCLPPWHAARPQSKETLFWRALAELCRLKLISQGRLPNPWKRS
jgi:hypothetical protein